jgi:uncharacterized protein
MQSVNGRITLSPSDLNDYVECPHLTTLALEVARGERPGSYVADEAAELLRRKGAQHERAYLERLRAEGRHIVEIELGDPWDFEAAAERTAEAMQAGVDAISQATFVDGSWRGRSDFLLKTDRPTGLGPWGYEPLDAKLARVEKPTYVLQLCFYSDGVAAIQGVPPDRMHVLLGVGEQRSLRHDDFAAYYRRVRAGFEAAIAAPAPTEPYPVEHCSLCQFRGVCAARWEAEDHLVLVASVRRDQVTRLRAAGLGTLTALAVAAAGTEVARLAAHTFETLRDQAALQLRRRRTGGLDWHAVDADPGCGFELLPRPSAGDIVFDIEGDPFWEPARGLHFLFGLLLRDGADWQYRATGSRPSTWRRSARSPSSSTAATSSSRARREPARRGRARASSRSSCGAAGASAWRRPATRRSTTSWTRSRGPRGPRGSDSAGSRKRRPTTTNRATRAA